jgi:antagonist of KipI
VNRFPRVRAVGDGAVSLELGDTLGAVVNAAVRATESRLLARPFPGFLESVPTHRALLVVFDPGIASLATASQALLDCVAAEATPEPPGRLHVLPTVYGGEGGPDLERVARHTGLSPDRVVARHAALEYRAMMLGFAPGFAYLGMLPPELDMPRLATPRPRVPGGSVAVAGRQTAVYPTPTAGGWNLIGRTAVALFDPSSAAPARICPGDRVRFEPVLTLPKTPPRPIERRQPAEPVVEVLEGGLLTTVQDAGRPGLRRLGVASGGAADAVARTAALGAVGGEPDAAVLECTVGGPRLRFLASVAFAVSGADLGARLERGDLGTWPVPHETRVLARAGNILSFAARRRGCRAYVAFAGGIDVPVVLGSRATDLGAGFGGLEGRALRRGDRLGRAGPPHTGDAMPTPMARADDPRAKVRVVLGPQADAFEPAAVETLLREEWRLATSSDRVGLRLEGPRLEHRARAEIVSDGMLPGCIQVPPDGKPIVMLVDAPTTGGYPKIATVVGADLGRLAQLLPGVDGVRLEQA